MKMLSHPLVTSTIIIYGSFHYCQKKKKTLKETEGFTSLKFVTMEKIVVYPITSNFNSFKAWTELNRQGQWERLLYTGTFERAELQVL